MRIDVTDLTSCTLCCTTVLFDEDEYELIRIPREIYPALLCSLKGHLSFAAAWMLAVRRTYPGERLLELLRSKLGLFPPALHTVAGDACIQVRHHAMGYMASALRIMLDIQRVVVNPSACCHLDASSSAC